MKASILATVFALPLLGLSLGSALADPPRGGPPGHLNKAGGHPPGLAKKPGGLPPGQARKAWRRGERLPASYLAPRYYIQPSTYRLAAPPPGYRWVLVEDSAYLVQNNTGLIQQVVAALLR